MEGLLRDIVERIVKEVNPERIILFGSSAKGTLNESSDIDILIIKKESDKRPIDRRIEIERLFPHRERPMDILVYTSEDIYCFFKAGSPFITEILKTGRVLYMRDIVKEWINIAEDEFSTASILYENRKFRGTCYHSQQCVEKALKALILEKGGELKKIHDIVVLPEMVKKLSWQIDIGIDDAVFLNSIYKGRYPSEEGLLPYREPDQEDAKKAFGIAKKAILFLKKTLT